HDRLPKVSASSEVTDSGKKQFHLEKNGYSGHSEWQQDWQSQFSTRRSRFNFGLSVKFRHVNRQ
ncbi:hypothetical protein, partial [Endozoicomonas sp. ONNA2]|uniref:hypothetical protein n=1 Tax=Endozoicomonas sp. ONNA2 TaxID=2828741 RepID=UPI0021471E03